MRTVQIPGADQRAAEQLAAAKEARAASESMRFRLALAIVAKQPTAQPMTPRTPRAALAALKRRRAAKRARKITRRAAK